MSMRTTIARWIAGGDVAPAVSNAADIPLPAIRRGSEIYDVFTGVPAIKGLPVVTEYSALSISAVWACVALIAGAISTLPMHLYNRMPDGERPRRETEDLWWTLTEEFCARWVASAGSTEERRVGQEVVGTG